GGEAWGAKVKRRGEERGGPPQPRHRSEREPSEPGESGEPRPVEHRHDPDALDRWRATGQFGAPWRANGLGGCGVLAVSNGIALQPSGSDLAEQGPFCALRRPCLDAAV